MELIMKSKVSPYYSLFCDKKGGRGMNAMRNLLKSRSGFTLVELMVVVVVLGILAGIAVQRMGDVRDRAETAAREANTRLLLGAANLAKTRNYGDYMFYYNASLGFPNPDRNGIIRWMRPCQHPPVTQLLTQGESEGQYYTGYTTIEKLEEHHGGEHCYWVSSQEWNLEDYLESFPVGYAVEIIFAARDENNDVVPLNWQAYMFGFHEDSDPTQSSPGGSNTFYDEDRIAIYRFIGDALEDADWNNTSIVPAAYGGHLEPGGTGNPRVHSVGGHYPYMYGTDGSHMLTSEDWEQVFPETN